MKKRKNYESPKLTAYGTLNQLTKEAQGKAAASADGINSYKKS